MVIGLCVHVCVCVCVCVETKNKIVNIIMNLQQSCCSKLSSKGYMYKGIPDDRSEA